MRKISVLILALFVLLSGLIGCSGQKSDSSARNEPPQLLIYCGITMVKPMREVADDFERAHGCRVILSQGGSEDLYQSLKFSRQGDLYLPGSEAYRTKHLSEGLLLDYVYLGFNQASLMVQKGNPHRITGDLDWLLDADLAVAIGNAESCSIGKQAKKILTAAGIYDEVAANCFTLAADSRNLNQLLKDKRADLILNWRATGFFAETRDAVEVIDLDPSVSPRKELLLNLLSFSTRPELARAFMTYAASPSGRAVFLKYGFLDDEGVESAVDQGVS